MINCSVACVAIVLILLMVAGRATAADDGRGDFNGLGMNLGNLSRLSEAKTRSISADRTDEGAGAGSWSSKSTPPGDPCWSSSWSTSRTVSASMSTVELIARSPMFATSEMTDDVNRRVAR